MAIWHFRSQLKWFVRAIFYCVPALEGISYCTYLWKWVSVEECNCYQLHATIHNSSLNVNSMRNRSCWRSVIVDFDILDQLLIRYYVLLRCWKKIGVLWNSAQPIYRLETSVSYIALTKVGIPFKLARVNETKSKVRLRKYLADGYPVENGLRLYRHSFPTLLQNTSWESSEKSRVFGIEGDTWAFRLCWW
jgi:hypothetical protein